MFALVLIDLILSEMKTRKLCFSDSNGTGSNHNTQQGKLKIT
jgi:hypothetical protein